MQSDYDLGRALAGLIALQGDAAFESGVVNRQILAQIQDLLGADQSLASPLRDLVLRPAFRQLFSHPSRSVMEGTREALLHDLSQLYSPTVLIRLNAVLNGCLALPDQPMPRPSPQPVDGMASTGGMGPPPGSRAAPPAPAAVPTPLVVAAAAPNQGLLTVLIATLVLLIGGLFVALAGVLLLSRPQLSGNNPTNSQAPSPAPSIRRPAGSARALPRQLTTPSSSDQAASTEPTAPDHQTREPAAQSSEQERSSTWQACQEDPTQQGAPAQAGETWWPVVGPVESLAAARSHCRPDAFVNRNGVVQIASFRDRDTAESFAQELTSDNSHPFSFSVGEATTR